MDSSALESAESWLAIIWWAKLAAAGFVALGVSVEFGSDWLAAPFEKTVSDAHKLEIATLEARAREAEKEISRVNDSASMANERAGRFEKEAEALRAKNIDMEAAIAPRILEQMLTSEALKPFSGTPFVVISPTDFEPKRTAGQIRFVLDNAKWSRFTEPLNLPPFPFFDGVSVHVMGIISRTDDPAGRAAETLISVLNDNGIVAKMGAPPMRLNEQGQPIMPKTPLSSNPPNVVIVEVGPKPLPASLRMGPPSTSDARGNKMWGNFAE